MLGDNHVDEFSFTHSAISSELEHFSISNFIDEFISKTLPALPNSESSVLQPQRLLEMPQGILENIMSFLDQRSALNIICTCSSLINAGRKRLFNRIVVVNDIEELRLLRIESVLPMTIIIKGNLIGCLDVIRMGDPNIGGYVHELLCFANLDWSSSKEFSLNDSWYLTAPMLTNLKSLIWPNLPILKYQALQVPTRLSITKLTVSFSALSEENLKSYDNAILTFPSVQSLIINLDQNEKIEDISLLSRLLVYGDVLENLTSLTIYGCLDQIISQNNTKPVSKFSLRNPPGPLEFYSDVETPQTPVKQTIKFNDPLNRDLINNGKVSLKDKLKHSFKSPVSPSKKQITEEFRALNAPLMAIESNHLLQVPKKIAIKSDKKNENFNSSVWSEILVEFGSLGKLNIKSLTLDKVLLKEYDIECLLKYVNLANLANLELNNVLIRYDESEDKLESKDFILLSLGPYFKNLKSLALDIRLESINCGIDCYKYGDLQIREFLASLPALENLHLVTHEPNFFEPEYLSAHQFSLKKISLSMPARLNKLIQLLAENQRLLNEFQGRGGPLMSLSIASLKRKRISKNLIKILENSQFNIALLDDISSPNIFKLKHYNESKNRIFSEHKYQLLNFLGDQFDDYVNVYPNLQEVSFFGVKFRTV